MSLSYDPLHDTLLRPFGPLFNKLLAATEHGSLSCEELKIGLEAMLEYSSSRCCKDSADMEYWNAIKIAVATLRVYFRSAVDQHGYRTGDQYTLKLLELLGDLRTGEPHERIAAAIGILERKEYLRGLLHDTLLRPFDPLYNELLADAKAGSLSCDALEAAMRAMLDYLNDHCRKDPTDMKYWTAIEAAVATLHGCFMSAVSQRGHSAGDRYALKLLKSLSAPRTGGPHERIAAAIDILKRKEYLRDCTVDDRQ